MSAEASPSHVAGPANTDADEVAVEPMDCEPADAVLEIDSMPAPCEGQNLQDIVWHAKDRITENQKYIITAESFASRSDPAAAGTSSESYTLTLHRDGKEFVSWDTRRNCVQLIDSCKPSFIQSLEMQHVGPEGDQCIEKLVVMLGFQNCSAPGAFAQRVNNAIRAIIKHEEAPFTNGRPLTELSQEQLKDLLRHGTKRREQFQLRFAPPGSLGACSYERWSYLPNALQRRMDAIKKAYADRLLSDGMAELERSVPASSSALGPNPAASANPLNVLIARAVQPGASSASHATAEAQVPHTGRTAAVPAANVPYPEPAAATDDAAAIYAAATAGAQGAGAGAGTGAAQPQQEATEAVVTENEQELHAKSPSSGSHTRGTQARHNQHSPDTSNANSAPLHAPREGAAPPRPAPLHAQGSNMQLQHGAIAGSAVAAADAAMTVMRGSGGARAAQAVLGTVAGNLAVGITGLRRPLAGMESGPAPLVLGAPAPLPAQQAAEPDAAASATPAETPAAAAVAAAAAAAAGPAASPAADPAAADDGMEVEVALAVAAAAAKGALLGCSGVGQEAPHAPYQLRARNPQLAAAKALPPSGGLRQRKRKGLTVGCNQPFVAAEEAAEDDQEEADAGADADGQAGAEGSGTDGSESEEPGATAGAAMGTLSRKGTKVQAGQGAGAATRGTGARGRGRGGGRADTGPLGLPHAGHDTLAASGAPAGAVDGTTAANDIAAGSAAAAATPPPPPLPATASAAGAAAGAAAACGLYNMLPDAEVVDLDSALQLLAANSEVPGAWLIKLRARPGAAVLAVVLDYLHFVKHAFGNDKQQFKAEITQVLQNALGAPV